MRNKLVITIHEKMEKAGEKTLFGFEMSVTKNNPEQPDISLIPVLASILPKVILISINQIQVMTGGHFQSVDNSSSLDTAMADLVKKIEAEESFPAEIE